VSFVVASFVCSTAAVLLDHGWQWAWILESTTTTFLYSLLLGAPGWLLALPVVLRISEFKGPSFVCWWFIGTLMGPLSLSGELWLVLLAFGHLGRPTLPIGLLVFSAAVASLTTLIYLLLVRFTTRALQLATPS
jgi:hypothetical protein